MTDEEFKELRKDVKECRSTLVDVRLDIERLKGRASVWGLVAGFVASLIVAWFGRS